MPVRQLRYLVSNYERNERRRYAYLQSFQGIEFTALYRHYYALNGL